MKTKHHKWLDACCRIGLFLFVAFASHIFVFSAPAQAGKSVSLALQWYPQAQFAGYYMAVEKGIYTKHGLDVTLLPGTADTNSLDRVVDGEADFCTAFLSAAMEYRSNGTPLVNIGQIVQRSALLLIARKDSGIQSIKDLDGARIGTWGNKFQLQPLALFNRENLDVTLVRQSPSFELFMRGGLDAVMAMWYNEYFRLISYGLNPEEMNTFFFSDLDLNQPEDGIYCLESTLNASPKAAAALVKASAEGWLYAFAHQDETVDVILAAMKQANIRANRAHQKWMLARMQDIILSEGNSNLVTRLKKNDFMQTKKTLLSNDVIETDISYTDFYKEAAQ
jgi:NitT/TauT family transport system substrate-binding protein